MNRSIKRFFPLAAILLASFLRRVRQRHSDRWATAPASNRKFF